MRTLRPLVTVLAAAAFVAGCDVAPAGGAPAAATTTVTGSPAAGPTSSLAATPATADPCHVNGVAYCVLNPAVTQSTIEATICVSGWTATVRPPVSYTDSLKSQQIAAEGLPGSMRDYEEDHRMPLELGGAPSDPANLSPESPASPNPKDADESALRRQVCSGRLTLAQAQQQLVTTWLAAYPGYTH